MCFYYDGYNEFERSTHPKGRKDHKCCECRDVIPKGVVHWHFVSKYDGELWDRRVCKRCEWLHDEIVKAELDAGCAPGESHCPIGALSEYIGEYGLSFDMQPPAMEVSK